MSEQVCTCQDMFSTCVFLTASFSSLSSCCSASFSVSESHSMLVFFVSWKIRSKITIEQLFYSYYYFCWGKSSSVKTQLFYYWGNIGFLVSLPCVCVCVTVLTFCSLAAMNITPGLGQTKPLSVYAWLDGLSPYLSLCRKPHAWFPSTHHMCVYK